MRLVRRSIGGLLRGDAARRLGRPLRPQPCKASSPVAAAAIITVLRRVRAKSQAFRLKIRADYSAAAEESRLRR